MKILRKWIRSLSALALLLHFQAPQAVSAPVQSDPFSGSSLNTSLWTLAETQNLLAPPNGIVVNGGLLNLGVKQGSRTWIHTEKGFYMYQTHSGPFDVRARIRVRDWNNPNQRPLDRYSFGGIMLRKPPTGPNDEEYVFIAVGATDPASIPVIETKNTHLGYSSGGVIQSGISDDFDYFEAQLRFARDAAGNISLYSRAYNAPENAAWIPRPFSTANGAANFGGPSAQVQLGIMSYGYNPANDFRVIVDDFIVAGQTPPGDTEAPSVSMTSPAAGVVSGSVTLSANASDNVGVAGVRFQIDGNNVGQEDTSSPFSISFDTRDLSEGPHAVRAVARDAAGNSTTSAAVSITVDNVADGDAQAPSISMTSPQQGAVVSGTINLTANASDNVGVVGVQFQVDGNSVGTEDTAEAYLAAWDTRGLANGPHSVRAVARDAAGNSATSAAVSVTVDNATSGGVNIIIDNGGAGTSSTGVWNWYQNSHYGANALYAATGGSAETYRFTPTIPSARLYNVYAWNSCYQYRSTSVPHRIVHAAGETTVRVDQACDTGVTGAWFLLGQFSFNAGTGGYLEISDSGLPAGTYIGADAARFESTN